MGARSGEHRNATHRWRLWVDTGGTFTDCIGVSPEGDVRRAKVLSSGCLRGRIEAMDEARRVRVAIAHRLPRGLFDGGSLRVLEHPETPPLTVQDSDEEGWLSLLPASAETPDATDFTSWRGCLAEVSGHEEAPVLGARLLLGVPPSKPFPPLELRLATTRGTNALLERSGARVALFLTKGFADLLRIGTQERSDLFTLRIVKPEPLFAAVVEVRGRLDADGEVLEELDRDAVLLQARTLRAEGYEDAAVALMHSYRNPAQERELALLLREAGFRRISRSADLAPLIQVVPRAATAVVDAYLEPVLSEYLGAIDASLRQGQKASYREAGERSRDPLRLWVMTSAGGLVAPALFRAKDSLLSGPAGGVVGATAVGRELSREQVLSFDMGGTSTDVARTAGGLSYVFEHRVGDARIVAPALKVETVAAGGGSVCEVSDGRVLVGPRSAGASPGPACYGAGGPLTLTDVNLLLGRIDPRHFEVPLDRAAAERAAEGLMAELGGRDVASTLYGLLRIANERMAEAMRRVSIEEGYDPREHLLVAFGGAGPQHACALAELLGISSAAVPVDASLLSARGLGAAAVERFAHRQVLRPLETLRGGGLEALVRRLEADTRSELASLAGGEELEDGMLHSRRIARLRYLGQESTLDLDLEEEETADLLGRRFEQQYEELFGYRPERAIELESLRVMSSLASRGTEPVPVALARSETTTTAETPPQEGRLFAEGVWHDAQVLDRRELPQENPVRGPALITERHSTTVVEPGWSARLAPNGSVLLERVVSRIRS